MQLAAVSVSLVLVLSAAGYGIARGLTAKDYSEYNKCASDYMNQLEGRSHLPPFAVCADYLPD